MKKNNPKPNKQILLILILLIEFCFKTVAVNVQERLSYYQSQLDSAQQEMNVAKMASTYEKIVELCRNSPELKDKLAENLYQYGLWSSYAGNNLSAILAIVELLDMLDDAVNKEFKARANVLLGNIYFFLERWDDALVYYQKARDMAKELNIKQGISIAENNIGNIYQKKGDYSQAIKQYQYSLLLQEDVGDEESICNTYYNMGSCYRELGEIAESFIWFEKALAIAKEIGEREIHTLSLSELALLNAEKKQFSLAEIQITEAEMLAESTGLNQVLKEIYMVRSIIEEKRGNYKLSLDYFKKYKQLSDTLFNANSIDRLREYEVRYQTQEKELEIVRKQAEIDRHKTTLYIYTAILLTTVLVVFLLAYILILRNKRNKELKEINATKDKFFSIISHDLRTPVIAQCNVLEQLAKKGSTFNSETLSQYHAELLKSANYQSVLLNNLLHWAKLQTGRIPFNPTTFDMTEALQSEISMISDVATHKGIRFSAELPQKAIITGDKNMLITVIRNLLSNAVKFTPKGGAVTLDIALSGTNSQKTTPTTISISDTGVGISPEHLNNLFKLEKQHSTIGTAGEQGSGLGLIVCKELVEKHGSTLHVESLEEKGSRFWFQI